MSRKGSSTDGKTDLANGSMSSSPEEMSGAEEGRETSSGIEIEASDLSLSLTGDDGGPNRTSTESRDTDTESSGEDKDSDSMEDTGHYSINDENQVHDRSEEEDEEEEEEEEHPRHRVQRKRANRDQDSSDDERALEDWVSSETSALPRPRWQALPALRERELGSSSRFVYEACGARVFVQRFRLQHGLEGHTGCVNTLHFNQRGTWLASGSDDLKVVVWDWVRRQPVLDFESGHKSNVFQAKFLPNSGDSTLAMCARDGQVRVAALHAEPYIMFSTDKKSLLCIRCFRDMQGESRAHCVDLESAYVQGCERLEQAVLAVKALQTATREAIALLQAMLEEVRRSAAEEEASIHSLFGSLQDRLAERKALLLQAVQSQYEEKDKAFKEQLSHLATLLPTLQVHLVICSSFLSLASKAEFLDLGYELMERLQGIATRPHRLRPAQSSKIVSDHRAEFARCLEPLLLPPGPRRAAGTGGGPST